MTDQFKGGGQLALILRLGQADWHLAEQSCRLPGPLRWGAGHEIRERETRRERKPSWMTFDEGAHWTASFQLPATTNGNAAGETDHPTTALPATRKRR